ncbi:MAG: hypothetical protein CMN17_06835 [Roseovarius sp.]|nr:hypothetical protein [Roseovarius sp.]
MCLPSFRMSGMAVAPASRVYHETTLRKPQMSRHPAENLPLAVTPPHRLLQPHRRSPGVSPDALTETAMHLPLTETDALFYHHHAPARDGAPTFVFVNALTGSTDAWEAAVAPALRAHGFGTLSWNFRGQTDSPFDPALALTDKVIVADLERLLAEVAPARPILVGLSIGGLHAARAVLNGARAEGLVLLNTLREIGPRIDWVNRAMARIVEHGGVSLFLDALFPLLVNQDFAAQARPDSSRAVTRRFRPNTRDPVPAQKPFVRRPASRSPRLAARCDGPGSDRRSPSAARAVPRSDRPRAGSPARSGPPWPRRGCPRPAHEPCRGRYRR